MFDIHATKWATYPDASEREFVERVAAAGADGVGLLGWRDADVDALLAACDEHGIEWTSTAAGGAAGNGGDADAPSVTDPECHDDAVAAIEETCETVGEHVDRVIVTVGPDRQALERATQTTAIVSVLRAAAPAAAAPVRSSRTRSGRKCRRKDVSAGPPWPRSSAASKHVNWAA